MFCLIGQMFVLLIIIKNKSLSNKNKKPGARGLTNTLHLPVEPRSAKSAAPPIIVVLLLWFTYAHWRSSLAVRTLSRLVFREVECEERLHWRIIIEFVIGAPIHKNERRNQNLS